MKGIFSEFKYTGITRVWDIWLIGHLTIIVILPKLEIIELGGYHKTMYTARKKFMS